MALRAAVASIIDAPHPPRRLRTRTIVLPVAWGVFLFGSVYPWTYRPLMAAVTLIGLYGWVTAAPRERDAVRGVGIGLFVMAALVLVQLLPVPWDMLVRISPATDSFLRQYDVAYAIGRTFNQPVTHSLSVAPHATLLGLMFLVALGVFTVGCTAMLPNLSLSRLLNRLVMIGFIVALFGIIQKATFNDRIYWFWKPINVANNAFGPFVNRNHFAGWMLMTASLTAGYLRGLLSPGLHAPFRSWRDRAAWLSSREANLTISVAVALFVMVLSLVWSFSRSGIASMAIAGAMFGLHSTTRGRGRGPLLGVWFVLTALAIAVVWRGTADVSAWYSRTNTVQWRLEQWHDTWPIVRDFKWFGTGLNTYGVSLLLYPTSHPESIVREAHNDYLQVLSEGGMLLSLAAATLLALVMHRVRQAFTEPQAVRTYWIRVGAVTGLIAIAIQETFDFSLQLPGNAVLFAVLLAIALHRASVPIQTYGPRPPARFPHVPL